jgi:iron complex outermembrane receptor protein
MLMGCAAALPVPAWAGHEDDIVVTGHKSSGPATVESVDAERLEETTAIITPEDSLRYLPSLFVRKRHVGDTQSPLATRTSGVGASARSLIYADGLLLSALIGNNNTSASPRWGMVSPEEIERVDVLYGPFSAAYPGNSIGAVVNITTRVPGKSEGSISAATSVQSFEQYGTAGIFPARQVGATLGGRTGPLAWFLSASHVDSKSHPLAFVTVARPANPGSAGAPVSGAISDRNRSGAPIFVIGAAGLEDHKQDNLKLKLAWEAGPALRLTYRGGLFLNDTEASASTYLSGNRFAGTLNIGGRTVNVPASAFSNNFYLQDERHWMHGLTAEGKAAGLSWRAVASRYDFDKHEQRIPSGALPAAAAGGPGSIVRLDGTGWRTLDLELRRGGLRGGAHYDGFRLNSRRFATADWRDGAPGALGQLAQGRTRTLALWTEDEIDLADSLRLTLGARYEWWRAYGGRNFSLAPTLDVAQPARSDEGISPKATLRWLPARGWSLSLSAGQAYRFPTVSELYQAIATGPSLTVPRPEPAAGAGALGGAGGDVDRPVGACTAVAVRRVDPRRPDLADGAAGAGLRHPVQLRPECRAGADARGGARVRAAGAGGAEARRLGQHHPGAAQGGRGPRFSRRRGQGHPPGAAAAGDPGPDLARVGNGEPDARWPLFQPLVRNDRQ